MRTRVKKTKIEKSAAPKVEEQHDSIEKKIVQQNDQWCVVSESGRNMGCYDSKSEAVERLRQIEAHKSSEDKLPKILSWEAVRTGMIDPEGSGLPESLEKDVPPEFRFWNLEKEEDKKACRDALVEAQLFTEETIKEVNGELRRVEYHECVKMFLPPEYDTEIAPVVPSRKRPIEKVASYLKENDEDVVLFDEQVTSAVGLVSILEKVQTLKSPWIVATKNNKENKELFKPYGGFVLKSDHNILFATSAEIEFEDLIERVTTTKEEDILTKAFEHVSILKGGEERIIYGIVLEPDEVDSQNDTVSKDEIRQACHKFMEEFGNLGLQHQEMITGKIKLLENFIAPVDFVVDGQSVKEGTWLMKERVIDDDLWEKVKKGEITGYSIGGSARRIPV